MKFTTKTEYGLICLVAMARNRSKPWLTIHEIVEKERFSLPYIEKILQKLRAAKIVMSHQGKRGGYSLARDPSQITLKEIIEALEGATFEVYCQPQIREHIVCTHLCMCGVRPVWAKTKELLDKFYASVTLEMMAKEEREALASVRIAQKKEAEEILTSAKR
jgi:Rrf2 family protein